MIIAGQLLQELFGWCERITNRHECPPLELASSGRQSTPSGCRARAAPGTPLYSTLKSSRHPHPESPASGAAPHISRTGAVGTGAVGTGAGVRFVSFGIAVTILVVSVDVGPVIVVISVTAAITTICILILMKSGIMIIIFSTGKMIDGFVGRHAALDHLA
jgi:hypothetical protein